MKFKLPPGQDFSTEHHEYRSIIAEAMIPEKIHIFRRSEPADPKKRSGFNIHTRFILWICLKGSGRLLIDNVTYVLHEDDAIITFPKQPHLRLPLENSKVQWLLIRFSGSHPGWFNMFRNKLIHLPQKSLEYLQEVGRSYLKSSSGTMPGDATECACYLGLLLNSLRNAETVDNPTSRLATQGNELIKETCRLIMSPEFVGKSFKDIARHLKMSTGYLRTLFKQNLGYTPKYVMKEHRINTIQHLLLHSTLNITQIAEKCGFDSVYSFSRFFSKNCGISPRQYRKQHK